MKQAIKIHDLIEDVKNLFKEDIPKTVYWDYIDQFKEHLNAIKSSYNHERSERIFNDYKRQIDSYLSSKWNEKTVDSFWETEMIATTLQQYHLKNHPNEHLTYFYDSLRSDLNKILSDSGTLLRLEEYFVEVYIKNTLDEQYGLIDEFQRIPEVETDDPGVPNNAPPLPKHDHIFCNYGFELWEFIVKESRMEPEKWGFAADLSFFYHRLKDSKPPYIHVSSQSRFLDWIMNEYPYYKGRIQKVPEIKPISKLTRIGNKTDTRVDALSKASTSLEDWLNEFKKAEK